MQEDPFWVTIDGMTNTNIIVVVYWENVWLCVQSSGFFSVDSFTTSYFADIIIVVQREEKKKRHFLQGFLLFDIQISSHVSIAMSTFENLFEPILYAFTVFRIQIDPLNSLHTVLCGMDSISMYNAEILFYDDCTFDKGKNSLFVPVFFFFTYHSDCWPICQTPFPFCSF